MSVGLIVLPGVRCHPQTATTVSARLKLFENAAPKNATGVVEGEFEENKIVFSGPGTLVPPRANNFSP